MKISKNILIFLIIFFLQLNTYSQEAGLNSSPDSNTVTGNQNETELSEEDTDYSGSNSKQSTIVILSYAGDTVDKAKIGDKLKVHLKSGKNPKKLWVYAKSLKICALKPLEGEPNWYRFKIYSIITEGDTLSKILNPKNASKISVNLSIGTDLNSREIIADNFTIIFDNERKTRDWFSGGTSVVLFLLALFIIFRKRRAILRDHGSEMETPPYSLARSQMAFWTMIILIAFMIVWWNTGNIIQITGQVLALLGISAGTTIGANLMDNDDLANPAIIKRHQEENSSKKFMLNILSDQRGLSIHRFQNVVFTIAIGCYFLFEVIQHYRIPALNTELMILMGISSGTYLAIKKGENKAFQETPVG